jgi:hypothetical protein
MYTQQTAGVLPRQSLTSRTARVIARLGVVLASGATRTDTARATAESYGGVPGPEVLGGDVRARVLPQVGVEVLRVHLAPGAALPVREDPGATAPPTQQ